MPRPLATYEEYEKALELASKTKKPEARALLLDKAKEYEAANPRLRAALNPQESSQALGAPVRAAAAEADQFSQRSDRRVAGQQAVLDRARKQPFVLPGGEQISSVDFDAMARARGRSMPAASPNPSDAAGMLEEAASEEEQLGDAMIEAENLITRVGPPAGEFVPEGADWKSKLAAEIYEEPTLEQFQMEMGDQLPNIDKIGEGDERFRMWREAKARASYESARLNNRPWYRPSKSADTWATVGAGRNAAVAGGLGAVSGASADLHEIPTALAFGGQEVMDQRAIQEAHPYTAWPGRVLGTFGVGGVPSVSMAFAKGGLRLAEKVAPRALMKLAGKVVPKALGPGLQSALKAGVVGAGAAVGEERVRDLAQATAEEIGGVGEGFEGIEPVGGFDATNALIGGAAGVGLDVMGQAAKRSADSYLRRNTSPQRELRNFREAGGELGPFGGVREPPRLQQLEREIAETYKPGERPVDVEQHIVENIRDPMVQGEFDVDQALKSRLESEKLDYQKAHPNAEANLQPMVEHAWKQLQQRTDQVSGGPEAFANPSESKRVFRDNLEAMATRFPAKDRTAAMAIARSRGGLVKSADQMLSAGFEPDAPFTVFVPKRADVEMLERVIGRIDDEAGFARVKATPEGPWLDWARVVRETRDQLPDDYSGLMAQHDEAIGGGVARRERAGLPAEIRSKRTRAEEPAPPIDENAADLAEFKRFADDAANTDLALRDDDVAFGSDRSWENLNDAEREAVARFTFRHDAAIKQLERGKSPAQIEAEWLAQERARGRTPSEASRQDFHETLLAAQDSVLDLKRVFEKVPPATEIPIVYRGIGADEEAARRFLTQPEFTLDSTTSTSWSRPLAESFAFRNPDPNAKRVLLVLKHKSGRNIAKTSDIGTSFGLRSKNPQEARRARLSSEREVVLPPGARFRVTRRYADPDSPDMNIIVEAEEVGAPVYKYRPNLSTQQERAFENTVKEYGSGNQSYKTAQALRQIASSAKMPLGSDEALSIAGELEMLKAARWGDSLRVAEKRALPWADSMMSTVKYGLPSLRYRAQPMIEALAAEQQPLSAPLRGLLRRMRKGAPKLDPYRAVKPRMGGMSLRGGVTGARGVAAAAGPAEGEAGGELSPEDLENLARLLEVVQEDQQTQ